MHLNFSQNNLSPAGLLKFWGKKPGLKQSYVFGLIQQTSLSAYNKTKPNAKPCGLLGFPDLFCHYQLSLAPCIQ